MHHQGVTGSPTTSQHILNVNKWLKTTKYLTTVYSFGNEILVGEKTERDQSEIVDLETMLEPCEWRQNDEKGKGKSVLRHLNPCSAF